MAKRKSIFRVARRRAYTQLCNDLLRDASLSVAAKGLLAQVLSFPDDWEFNIEHMAGVSTDSPKKLRRILNELIARGYARRKRVLDRRTGQMLYWFTSFYESRHAAEMDAAALKELSLFELELDAGPAAMVSEDDGSEPSDPQFCANSPVGQIPDSGYRLSGFGQQRKNELRKNEELTNEGNDDDGRPPLAGAVQGTAVPDPQPADVVVVSLQQEAEFDERDARRVIRRHGVAAATKALRCLALCDSRPGNPRGYVIQAIRQDWEPKQPRQPDPTTKPARRGSFDAKAEALRAMALIDARKAGQQA